ncbi:hypothetical protein [Stieleria mannarensis]|uniref:hypothetical protein n=1 Tax=Stieleria mannarensis TaxID=2755585 RepID=UPI0015FFDACF|nr:hypothetical protein [Rhodopirellula sp. JC639]
MESNFRPRDFARKVGHIANHVAENRAISNLGHGVSDAARRNATRSYRRMVVRRINQMFKDNPTSRENALRRLRESDIDHIHELQLNGENVRRNLKALHSATNQGIGNQISIQLPLNKNIAVSKISVR